MFKFESTVFLKVFADTMKKLSWNWCKMVSEKAKAEAMPHLDLTYNVGTIFEVASDTSTIVLESLVIAALLNPHVVKKAQDELDTVVGPHVC